MAHNKRALGMLGFIGVGALALGLAGCSSGDAEAGGEASGEAGAGEEPEEEEEEEEEGGFLGYRDDAFHAAQRVPLTAATPSHGSGGGGGLIGRHPSRDSLGPP